jgi:hypothetical protein
VDPVLLILFAIPAHILTNKSNNFNLKNTLLIGGLVALTVDVTNALVYVLKFVVLFAFFIVVGQKLACLPQKITKNVAL